MNRNVRSREGMPLYCRSFTSDSRSSLSRPLSSLLSSSLSPPICFLKSVPSRQKMRCQFSQENPDQPCFCSACHLSFELFPRRQDGKIVLPELPGSGGVLSANSTTKRPRVYTDHMAHINPHRLSIAGFEPSTVPASHLANPFTPFSTFISAVSPPDATHARSTPFNYLYVFTAPSRPHFSA